MPVTSTRRYSSSYLTPSSTTSSTVGSYRSNYSSISSSSTKDLPPSSSRYNFGDSSTYRSTYRSSLSSGISSTTGTTGSYRSRYDFDDTDKKLSTGSSTLSTRIGVSKTSSSRFNSDTLPPLPPSSSSAHTYHSKRSLSRSRDVKENGENGSVGSSKNGDRTNGKLSLMNDLDFYEKYSPSRYMTKYELSRSRSETAQTPTRDKSPSSSNSVNDTPIHTPKCEVCQTTNPSTLSLV